MHSQLLRNFQILSFTRPADCLYSPGVGPNSGIILYCPDGALNENSGNIVKLPYATKDFQEWKDALNLKVGNTVSSMFFDL